MLYPITLFSFLFCYNFSLNGAQQLSDSNKSKPKRFYGHQRYNYQRKASQDDFSIPTKNHTHETNKRHSVPAPINIITSDDFYPKSYSDSNVNQNRKSLGYSPFKTRSKKKLDTVIPLDSIVEKPENRFLTNIRKNEVALVKSSLKNPYLPISEIVDNWGNTALHIAALADNFKIIRILLLDPRIDASKRNRHGSHPRDLLDKTQEKEGAPLASEEIVKYKRMLFARSTLNILVNGQAQEMYRENNTDEKNINTAVAIIKETINKTKEKQTSALPNNALLPSYATDEFITLMLYYELSLLSQKNK